MEDFRIKWELYSSAWKKNDRTERIELLKQGVEANCTYTDPNIVTRGYDELIKYMENFHSQVPGGHFETVDFIFSSLFWFGHMEHVKYEGEKIGFSHSHLKYSSSGNLLEMTGFFRN